MKNWKDPEKHRKLLQRDRLLLMAFALLWLAFGIFVLEKARALAADTGVRLLLTSAFALSAVAVGGAALMVGRHLSRERRNVYGEAIYYGEQTLPEEAYDEE